MNDIISGSISGCAQVLIGYPLDTLKIYKQNHLKMNTINIKTLYSGVKYPMTSSVINNGVVFSVNKLLKQKYNLESYISGFLAGILITPNVFFFDKLKINRQLNNTNFNFNFRNLKGLPSTFGRESIAFSVYFSTYDYLRKKDVYIPIAGAFAGISNWTITYPLDIIRNRQIAQNINFNKAINQGKLWAGIEYCLIRALIVNAMAFSVYEKTSDIINKLL